MFNCLAGTALLAAAATAKTCQCTKHNIVPVDSSIIITIVIFYCFLYLEKIFYLIVVIHIQIIQFKHIITHYSCNYYVYPEIFEAEILITKTRMQSKTSTKYPTMKHQFYC